ncbi:hypothetical protein [Streptomyces sp. NPDC127066]|uniref:hypothetical protein n=1 Tax=Streptomyces sp. NPDC127066 TaxID=3347125 RepID=UPI0036536F08
MAYGGEPTQVRRAGDAGDVMALHRLVVADPAVWTVEVPAVLAALELPELGALGLAADAVHADRPGAYPDGELVGAVTATHGLRRALDRLALAGQRAVAAGSAPRRAWSGSLKERTLP